MTLNAADLRGKAVDWYIDQIIRLQEELRIAEYDRDVIAPTNAGDVEALVRANGQLQAVVEAARRYMSRIEFAQDPMPAAGSMLRAALAALDSNEV